MYYSRVFLLINSEPQLLPADWKKAFLGISWDMVEKGNIIGQKLRR